MTDLYDEWWTQRAGIDEAVRRGGEVLITGLGLGLVAESILRHPQSRVERITIVEFSADVIQLVAPYLRFRYPGKIDVIESDAFTWEPPPGRRFTVVWHDIWPDPHAVDNSDQIRLLEKRYQPWCDWQGFWPQTYLEALYGAESKANHHTEARF
jgi:spermidine synthase